jgi:hypothetical protein
LNNPKVDLWTYLIAAAQDRYWHTFPVRCAAAIASGYRITFVVLVARLAGELLTHSSPRLPAPVALQQLPHRYVRELISWSGQFR